MKRKMIGFLLILSLLFVPSVFALPVPQTVGTSITDTSTELSFQRKSWTAAGRFWVGYSDGNGASDDYNAMLIKSTPIGSDDWILEPTVGGHRDLKDGKGYNFAIHWDGTYVHIVKAWDDTGVFPTLSYRRGIPEEDGSITWSAVWQTIEKGDVLRYNWYPMITVDSNGYAHVTSQRRTNGNWGATYFVNANNDGTWSGASSGFLRDFGFNEIGVGVPIALGDDVYYIYRGGNANTNIYVRKWNGTLQAESVIAADAVSGFVTSFSAVDYDGKIYLAYSNNGAYSYLRIFDGTSWGDAIGLFGNYGAPVVSVVGEQIWFYYARTDETIHVRKYDDGWLGAQSLYITGTALSTSEIGSFYESDAHTGVMYTEHGSDIVMFGAEGLTSGFEITNREKTANIAKADYKEYQMKITFDDPLTLNIPDDTIGLRFDMGSRRYLIYYNISDETLSTDNATHMYIRTPVFTFNTTNAELTFYWYPLSYIPDTANVDFYVMGNTSTYEFPWTLVADNHVDFISYSGVTKYTISGDAGRITNGDWLNLRAANNSGVTVEYIANNIQGVFLTLSLNPAYGATNQQEKDGIFLDEAFYRFGLDYSIEGQGWIGGWDCTLYPYNVSLDANNNYITFRVVWTMNGSYTQTDYIAGYWHGLDSGDDRINFVIRLWFNRENGSSVAGGWIQPLEYGLSDTAPWWNPFGNWQPVRSWKTNDVPLAYMETPTYSSFFFVPLLDSNDNIISYKDIDTTKFYSTMWGLENLTAGDEVRISSINSLEIVKGGMQDSHSSMGIPTPAPLEPLIITKGFFAGFIRWASTAVYSLARNVQVTFFAVIDWILTPFLGAGAFSAMARAISTMAGGIITAINLWVFNVSGYILTHMVGFFGIVSKLLVTLFAFLNAMIGPMTFIWNSGSRFFGMADALFGGKIYIAPSGQIWDFTNLSGFNIFGYPALYGIFALGLGLYIIRLPILFGLKLAEQDYAGAANVFAEPIGIIYKVTWLLYKLISLPLRGIKWLLSLIRG